VCNIWFWEQQHLDRILHLLQVFHFHTLQEQHHLFQTELVVVVRLQSLKESTHWDLFQRENWKEKWS
jgi:hypothetical protein